MTAPESCGAVYEHEPHLYPVADIDPVTLQQFGFKRVPCPGVPQPVQLPRKAIRAVSRHPACRYDGPHTAHNVVVLTPAGVNFLSVHRTGPIDDEPMLSEELCPGEPPSKWCRTHGQPWPQCVDASGLHQIEDTP